MNAAEAGRRRSRSRRARPTCVARRPGKADARRDVVPVLALERVVVVGPRRRGDRGIDRGEAGVLHVLRHDERVDRILGVRQRLEVDVADAAVDLFGQAEELVAHAEVQRQRLRQPPVVREEHVEVVEAELLVGDPELRIGFGRQAAEQLREVVELLELGRLFLRQIRIELVAAELAAHAERVRR